MKDHDTFMVDPMKEPNKDKKRVLRFYPEGGQKQCWILNQREIQELYKVLGDSLSRSVREGCNQDLFA